jgi:rRNA-processing protein FCF1
MPLYNWIKCTEGDLTHVRKAKEGNAKDDIEAWTEVHDSYIEEFGLSEVYKKMLDAMRKKALIELDYVITGDRFKLTEAEIQAAKLQLMMANGGNGMTIEQTLIYISKWIGQWINPKQITAREYFNLLKEYGKANKSN